AGAAWDRSVGPPEVAAVLARMAQEEKIATRVEKKTLHMTLQTNRGALSGYERELVTAMFVNGDSTSTDQIRTHYSSRGFNPAEKIRSGIETKLAALPQWRGTDHSLRVKPHVWSLVVAFLLVGACVFVAMHELDIVFVFLTLFAGGILGGIAAGVARSLSKSVTRGPAGLLIPPLLLLTFAAAPFLVTTLNARALDLRPPLLIAQALWLIAWARLIFALLASPDSAEKIAFRKRIAGLREYFREELKKPQPALRDEWYPHLLAFGLGTNVDRWFRAHGGTAESTHGSSWTSSSSSSSSGSSSSSSSWTGGGGAFGGAGASGTWAVAAAGMAAGVSAPSSSSGSGGGGGSSSSSSGGGGGGGW
ncbi:MAG TPA: hypothetical protein VFO89_01200, partial [Thermoanaerobaculia bacterium]|nr:hypothetical protein [Thermoanaerobaculia bacterium]